MSEFLDLEECKEMYLKNRWGLSRIKNEFELKGKKYSVGFLANRFKENGIELRDASQAATFRTGNDLDHSKSYMTEDLMEAIDGWTIGDGYISSSNQVARISCGVQHKEFCDYVRTFFTPYFPTESKLSAPSINSKPGSTGTWGFRTLSHPDLLIQHKRWYPNGKKIIPKDVRITPTSVLLWYLGDGTLVVDNESNTAVVRLSTDCFTIDDVNFLVSRLEEIGISCTRTSENRIRIIAEGIKPFFDFIGRKSPIECYSYKFSVPEWRYNTVRASVVAKQLNVGLSRLQHLIKTKEIPVIRLWDKGRPMFDEKSINVCKELIKSGRLY